MHMRPTLTRRMQVLLDDERYERLASRAETTGSSIGALIRNAIDVAYPRARLTPREAADRLLAAEPMEVEDWPVMKRQIRDEMFGVDDVASGDSGGAVFSIPPYSFTPSGATIRTVTPAVG